MGRTWLEVGARSFKPSQKALRPVGGEPLLAALLFHPQLSFSPSLSRSLCLSRPVCLSVGLPLWGQSTGPQDAPGAPAPLHSTQLPGACAPAESTEAATSQPSVTASSTWALDATAGRLAAVRAAAHCWITQ